MHMSRKIADPTKKRSELDALLSSFKNNKGFTPEKKSYLKTEEGKKILKT